jgi:3-methyladenine DNA glycosylase AlkD
MNAHQILAQLQSLANPANVAGMARYGINPDKALGISIPTLRAMAKQIGKNHQLAEELWASGIHEARILASIIDDAHQVTEEQMERWVADFDSWDVCDQVCSNLFDKTTFAHQKVIEWSGREAEFIKRAGFAMMAALAVHDKRAGDERFEKFFPVIVRQATDGRNYVKKAVSWALRNIGKRNRHLNTRAIEIAREIAQLDSQVARWIGNDALKELKDVRIMSRF